MNKKLSSNRTIYPIFNTIISQIRYEDSMSRTRKVGIESLSIKCGFLFSIEIFGQLKRINRSYGSHGSCIKIEVLEVIEIYRNDPL